MHGVACPIRDYFPQDLFTKQGQIAHQIKNFVTDEFVCKSQRPVLNPVAGENGTILARGTTDQPHIAHRPLVLARTEGTRPGYVFEITSVREFDPEGFFPNQRMRKINRVRDRIGIIRVDRDELVAFANLEFSADPEILASPTLLSNAHLADHVDKRLGAAIEDGQLEVIE